MHDVLTAGKRVVYQGASSAQLGTVESATELADILGGRRTSTAVEVIVVVRFDDGSIVPVPEHRLTEADESRPDVVYFTPAASMTRTKGGWELALDFSDSAQGGELAGVMVDMPMPTTEAACEALDAALKRSPWYGKGSLRFLISDPALPG